MQQRYPTEFPKAEVQTLIDFIKETFSGTGDMILAAEAGWYVQGYLMRTVLGSHADDVVIMEVALTEDDKQQLEELANLMMAADSGNPELKAGLGDWAIEKIVMYILTKLIEWLKQQFESRA